VESTFEESDEIQYPVDEKGRKIVGEFYVGDDGELYRIADDSPRVAICPTTGQPYVTRSPGQRMISNEEMIKIIKEMV